MGEDSINCGIAHGFVINNDFLNEGFHFLRINSLQLKGWIFIIVSV